MIDEDIRLADGDKFIWCKYCECYVKESELKVWSGDDSRHFLCPGCDADLLPSQDLEDFDDYP